MTDTLHDWLSRLAAEGETTSYARIIVQFGFTGPDVSRRLTELLETLMEKDHATGRPFVAAICCGRQAGGIPMPSFFLKAAALGCYTGPASGPEALAFAENQRRALRSMANA